MNFNYQQNLNGKLSTSIKNIERNLYWNPLLCLEAAYITGATSIGFIYDVLYKRRKKYL
jgi:hypothetical protein